MNASELRIGNFVELTCEGHEDEPDLVIWGIEDYEYYDYRMNDINPIPITEEWLVKCGFEKRIDRIIQPSEIHYVLGKFILLESVRGFVLCDIGIHIVVLYLHQLQNLYFALTNTELTINL